MSDRRSPDEAALLALAPLVLPALVGSAGAGEWATAKDRLRDFVRRDPLDANVSFVLGATAAFYVAEKGTNPKVETFVDALLFVTTCLTVGYADVFARTQTGKLIASIVMSVGPALSEALFNPPAGPPQADPGADSDPRAAGRYSGGAQATVGRRGAVRRQPMTCTESGSIS